MGHSNSGLILLLLIAGCPKPAAPPADNPPAGSTTASVSIPPPPTAPPLATSPVEVRMTGTKPAAFQIVSTGPAVDLSRDIRVEAGPLIQLVEKCDRADAGACVPLPAGGTLTPVPWTGFDCDAQCPRSCRANAYMGPGRFRYVVKSCDGTRQWESAWFDLPAYKP